MGAEPANQELNPDDREHTALDKESVKQDFVDNLFYVLGKFPGFATSQDHYRALAQAVRDRLLQRWISSSAAYSENGARTVAYLSAEFLVGPHLANNLINLGMYEATEQAIKELGLNLADLIDAEVEPGLGNGGLGRLAACFLDSLATLQIPAVGYGIRYEYGIFEQQLHDGWQVEKTDKWLRYGNSWEVVRPEWQLEVHFGGHVERFQNGDGKMHTRWVPDRTVIGVPHDTPILGYRNNTANSLRLWRAEAPESFDFAIFNRGDFAGAASQEVESETLTKVLYPNDDSPQGKRLRLAQQYFFVSCSIQDMVRITKRHKVPIERFHEKFAIQLNDTHPAIAVAELMRLLLDQEGMEWDKAWEITRKSLSYTNHTILPEALERWPLDLVAHMLPRHMEIIFEINARFLNEMRVRFLGNDAIVARLSLIDESGERYVRMANIACVGSHAINGVAALHTELLKRDVLHDFYSIWPEKFSNKTNGVTPRRWLVVSNPRLTKLVTGAIGDKWITNLDELKKLEPFVDDAGFCADWAEVKLANKRQLADYLARRDGVTIDPASMFDVQVKRIHEYKRQHLNILHVMALYLRLRNDPHFDPPPRTVIFGGKAAPGYAMAKQVIKLINSVGEIVNNDPGVSGRLRVAYLPNFNVKFGHHVYPAAELSEQISTAGKEASGTGNMKFQMNGALTIGTLDGANIEIREEVGDENFFLFGLTTEEVLALQRSGYRPYDYYENTPELREALDLLRSGFFSRGDTGTFQPIIDNLLNHDPFLVLADYAAYAECQGRVSEAYRDQKQWIRKSILNTARSGKFSSDRTIADYCREIWNTKPLPIELVTEERVKASFLKTR
jgi:starch phosphorylase